MKKFVWLSFDLGVKGDYEGLYTWLDSQDARECGEYLAGFDFEASDERRLPTLLKKALSDAVDLDKRSRIYVVFFDSRAKKVRGQFIFGSRKRPPWTGYGGSAARAEEDLAG
jgi:hypothetical protein